MPPKDPFQRLSSTKRKAKAKAKRELANRRAKRHANRNSGRAVKKTLRHDSPLPSPYIAEITVWGRQADTQTTQPMAFNLVHELLEVMVPPRAGG